MKFAASESMLAYFNTLENELNRAIDLANRARANGADPLPTMEIPIAKDLADRVEKLIGVEGVAKRLRELEMTMSREEASLQLGLEVAEGKIKKFESKKDAIESAVRISMAVLTEGVVAAPIEGIAKIDLAKNDDGTDYIRIYYAGPIRSAGGTAQALSVLAADYIRANLGISPFMPRPDEVERYVEEITAYRRVANLQYLPSDDEIRLIVRNCPICIDGEPTEEAEVEGRRDLERVETNRIRGGMALVIAEGIALKAPKVKKHVDKLKLQGWNWLDKFVVTAVKTDDSSAQIKPKDKYLQDLIAGRPVFSYPSMPGGFRLRYGRSRNTCFAAAGISPATMVMMDDFIAAGTQIKVERPGKAAGIGPVDSIDGPTVRLFNGDVVRVDNAEEALKIRPSVQRILDIGEILINFGDFLENNHPLVPSSYCYEWWIQELALKTQIKELGDLKNPDAKTALSISDTYKVPLHPKFTYLWHDIKLEDYSGLADYIQKNGKIAEKLSFPLDDKIKDILENLLLPHIIREKQIYIEEPLPFIRCLGLDENLKKTWTVTETSVIDTVTKVSGITVRNRAPIRIGGRMGRPEKSDKREMKPAPHVLFPIGDAGGKKRSLKTAKEFVEDEPETNRNTDLKMGLTVQKEKVGTINVEIGARICPSCGIRTFKNRCKCREFTIPVFKCESCGIEVKKIKEGKDNPGCPKCKKETTSVTEMEIDFKSEYLLALENLGEREVETIKGVLGLMSKNKTPEPLEKGILRAKHGIVMFKDGTVRYDLSDMPLTHIKPKEIGVTVSKLKELGYEKDTYGNPLVDENQVLELKVQDIVVSKDCGEYLLKTAGFIDDLLVKYYKVTPYYDITCINDLIGKLVIGLAPHTSAGVLGRLVGFTTASVGYAHPFFHAAKRRNCDGDEDCVMLLMDGLLNFSRSYLPDRRGGQMDAPLVLTSRIDPNEVDKEAHNIDVLFNYPLEFYEATLQYKNPKDIVKIMDTVTARLGTPAQYEGFGFTHDTTNIAAGPRNSAYKTIGTMIEKMDAQLALARKIKAVDPQDVAERIINSHFLPDLIGNLRSFSKQKVRCTKCGAKYRRPPLRGTCPKCGGNIVLTVHEGSVKKYLETSLRIADEYNVRHYTKQRLELLEIEMRSLFENDKVKQKGLADFM